jgi:hypothetical protein
MSTIADSAHSQALSDAIVQCCTVRTAASGRKADLQSQSFFELVLLRGT